MEISGKMWDNTIIIRYIAIRNTYGVRIIYGGIDKAYYLPYDTMA